MHVHTGVRLPVWNGLQSNGLPRGLHPLSVAAVTFARQVLKRQILKTQVFDTGYLANPLTLASLNVRSASSPTWISQASNAPVLQCFDGLYIKKSKLSALHHPPCLCLGWRPDGPVGG